MDLEKLKALLESGAITQEDFDSMSQLLAPPTPPDDPTDPPGIDEDKISRLIQAGIDKALAKERKTNTDLKRQLDTLKKEKLSTDELKQLELDTKEQQIAERERELAEKENRLIAIKAIKAAGLDDGSDIALSIVDFVTAESEEKISENVAAFKAIFEKAVAAEVDRRLKSDGYTPKKSGAPDSGNNPYSKEHFNFTEQMRLENSDPALAARLKAAAGN